MNFRKLESRLSQTLGMPVNLIPLEKALYEVRAGDKTFQFTLKQETGAKHLSAAVHGLDNRRMTEAVRSTADRFLSSPE